jgi:hypothetical protein
MDVDEALAIALKRAETKSSFGEFGFLDAAQLSGQTAPSVIAISIKGNLGRCWEIQRQLGRVAMTMAERSVRGMEEPALSAP